MEWPILTAIAALAFAAIFVGALFLKIGEPLNYIPQCSDCQFFVKGPASLVQTNGSAYLIRGAMLTPSSILAEYGWAYDGAGRPLKPGQSIYCEKGIFVRVVGGIAQASCNNFSAPIQLAYSGYTPISPPPIIICKMSTTLTWPPPKTAILCFHNSINFSKWRVDYSFSGERPDLSLTVTLKDKAGNTVSVTIYHSYTIEYLIDYKGSIHVRRYPYCMVGASENGVTLRTTFGYEYAYFHTVPSEMTVIVTSNAVIVAGPNPSMPWHGPAEVFPLYTPLAKDYLNVTLSASSRSSNTVVHGASVSVVSS